MSAMIASKHSGSGLNLTNKRLNLAVVGAGLMSEFIEVMQVGSCQSVGSARLVDR